MSATILALSPLILCFTDDFRLLLLPIVAGPGSMWLSYQARKLAPENRFLRWYPYALFPFAFGLVDIAIGIWRASRPGYRGGWP